MMKDKFGYASMLLALCVAQFQPLIVATLTFAYEASVSKREVRYWLNSVQRFKNCNIVSVQFQCTFTAADAVRYLAIADIFTLTIESHWRWMFTHHIVVIDRLLEGTIHEIFRRTSGLLRCFQLVTRRTKRLENLGQDCSGLAHDPILNH